MNMKHNLNIIFVLLGVLTNMAIVGAESTQEALHKAEEEASTAAWAMTLLISLLALSLIAAYLLRLSNIHFLHESGAAILLGIIVGLIVYLSHGPELLSDMVSFNPEFFFLVLLPPIIFNAGYSMKRKNFFRNFGSIVVFAVVGTLISAAFVGGFIYLFGVWGWCEPLPMLDSFLFGSLISAVDPVTVIAIFETLKTDITLHALVFGESIINDAVCIVLFRTLSFFPAAGPIDSAAIWGAIGRFLGIFLGSMGLGIAIGLMVAFFFKHSRVVRLPELETGLFLLGSYLPYLVAEATRMSGIVSLLFAAIVMSHYTYYNLSPQSRKMTKEFWHVLAFVAETFVFVYMGLSMFSMTGHSYKPGLIIWSIVLCVVARALNIFPLSWILNHTRKSVKISMKHRTMLWWSGLRGAIAFALAVSTVGIHAHTIVTTTLVTVMFTVFVLGGGAYKMLRILKIKGADETTQQVEESIIQGASKGTAGDFGKEMKWHSFDRRWLKPIFIRSGARKDGETEGGMLMRDQGPTTDPAGSGAGVGVGEADGVSVKHRGSRTRSTVDAINGDEVNGAVSDTGSDTGSVSVSVDIGNGIGNRIQVEEVPAPAMTPSEVEEDEEHDRI